MAAALGVLMVNSSGTIPDDALGAFCRHTHVAVAGSGKGPLAGLTFGVKDIYDIAGHKTGCGSPDWLASHAPARDTALVVASLLDAGANMLGKTQTDELTYSLNGENAHYGTPVNVNAPANTSVTVRPLCPASAVIAVMVVTPLIGMTSPYLGSVIVAALATAACVTSQLSA